MGSGLEASEVAKAPEAAARAVAASAVAKWAGGTEGGGFADPVGTPEAGGSAVSLVAVNPAPEGGRV